MPDTSYHWAVTTARSLDPGALSTSPYARELRRGVPDLRFEPRLEAEYRQSRLSESRVLIRVACVLSAVLAVLRGAEKVYEGALSFVLLIDLAIVIGGSISLAAIAWSSQYQRLYMPWARILVPTRNVVIAAQVASVAAHGQVEMLMVLPIMLFGPFYFLGLRYRAALICSLLTVAAYVVSATFFSLPWSTAVRSYVFLLIGLIAYIVAARHLERTARLAFLEGRLITELAQHDGLTGTKNRRVFDEHLYQLWQRAVDHRHCIAIVLIDIDHFKAYNDRYGHQAGDQALCCVAQALRDFVREPADIVARYGGEEFAVILYDADIGKAREVADQMRRAVAELKIEHRGSGTCGRVTISLGVAAVVPDMDRSPCGALQLADEALYAAKVRGRNRVEVRDEGHHDLLVTGVFSADTGRAAGIRAGAFE
jgi:diguanylate cyclase (GGDEF)-like protein